MEPRKTVKAIFIWFICDLQLMMPHCVFMILNTIPVMYSDQSLGAAPRNAGGNSYLNTLFVNMTKIATDKP